jgi:hypothetical protein
MALTYKEECLACSFLNQYLQKMVLQRGVKNLSFFHVDTFDYAVKRGKSLE